MVNLIPQPQKIKELGRKIKIGAVKCDKRFGAAADAYEKYRTVLYNKECKIEKGPVNVEAVFADKIEYGGYVIDCSEGVRLYASDESGINNAFATLLQLEDEEGQIEAVCIEDCPDCEYRGLMIDLARIWHPFEYLLKYVDLCRFYKLSYLHLHFTDTQSYTLPCDTFPLLPTPDRHYTKEQIKELNEYAKARGITVMPEIDVPGHCDPFLKAYPDLFGHNGIIGFHKEVFDAFGKIIAELCEMFPYSDRIHIGGDEADIKQWLSCEKCRGYAAECGIPVDSDERLSSERMLAMFVRKLSDSVLDNFKIPVVWEGFCREVNHIVSPLTQVFSWENYYQTTPELIEAGFMLINGTWSPNYIVAPDVCWSVKDCFDWDIFTFRPVHPGSPYIKTGLRVPDYDKMIGGQLLSWGDKGAVCEDKAAHLRRELELVSERVPATSENTWNKYKLRGFDDFEKSRAALSEKFNRIIKAYEK